MPNPKAATSKPFLSLRDACFRLGDRLVFQGTTWILREQEQWAIIGPNGAGKSIFADGLRGRLPLVSGEMTYHFSGLNGASAEDTIGHVTFADRKKDLHGAVVQSRWTSFEQEGSRLVEGFLSYDSVMEINPFEVKAGQQKPRRQFQRRLAQATRLLGIESFLRRTLLSLSNGERQRVQIARALAQPLRLLILDEPYVGLDVAAQKHFHELLENLLMTRLRVLLVTARVEDLPEHVTHLLRVEDCQVIAAGPRATVMETWPRLRGAPPRQIREPRSIADRHDLSHGLQHPSGETIVQLDRVTVRYGAVTVLKDLSWTVKQGESWALLGPNGSGKTTLLSLIQGDHPQAYMNRVMVFGRQRGTGESLWELKRRIGWVSPELQLHFNDNVSVLDAVLSGLFDTIGLFERPSRSQVAAARQWLARFDLLPHGEAPVYSLSAGLQRLTLLARALVKNPPLLILDEPCQGLDLPHRDCFIRTVDDLIRSKSTTAIFVTHRQEEIPPSIKRVLRLSKNASDP